MIEYFIFQLVFKYFLHNPDDRIRSKSFLWLSPNVLKGTTNTRLILPHVILDKKKYINNTYSTVQYVTSRELCGGPAVYTYSQRWTWQLWSVATLLWKRSLAPECILLSVSRALYNQGSEARDHYWRVVQVCFMTWLHGCHLIFLIAEVEPFLDQEPGSHQAASLSDPECWCHGVMVFTSKE